MTKLQLSADVAALNHNPACVVCQQYNLARRIMAAIDQQPDSGGALYDDAITSIYNAADDALSVLRHEHQVER